MQLLTATEVSPYVFGFIPKSVLVMSIFILFGLSLIPGIIAVKKGYSGIGFFLFGILCLPLAIATALIISDKEEKKKEQKKVDDLIDKLNDIEAHLNNLNKSNYNNTK